MLFVGQRAQEWGGAVEVGHSDRPTTTESPSRVRCAFVVAIFFWGDGKACILGGPRSVRGLRLGGAGMQNWDDTTSM